MHQLESCRLPLVLDLFYSKKETHSIESNKKVQKYHFFQLNYENNGNLRNIVSITSFQSLSMKKVGI